MSMEINGSYNHSNINYAEQLKEKQALCEAEKTKETTSDKLFEPHDEYINSEKSGTKPSGLYRVGQDENGNRKIYFEDPNKSGNEDGEGQPKVNEDGAGKNENGGQPKVSGDNSGKPAEKCVANTDKVDREIKKLKEKKQQLERQIRSASGDEKKVRELKNKLAQVENELSQKDNDAYRRQNTVFTNQ